MDAHGGIRNPHFIHITTILYHFAPLSTTCMSIIVQKLGNGKEFLRISYKKISKKQGSCVVFRNCLYMWDTPTYKY
ncbi:hypothetical protein CBFG_05045 [Clostridiales bacterium 1_7_47FAA]|nr:hypothetical protein CBFG_05045 [Clostridiales bacterium 1_7_47FAA]